MISQGSILRPLHFAYINDLDSQVGEIETIKYTDDTTVIVQ